MSMTYAQLTANIEDICETSFTSDQLAMFTKQAEQREITAKRIIDLIAKIRNTLTSIDIDEVVGFLSVINHQSIEKTIQDRLIKLNLISINKNEIVLSDLGRNLQKSIGLDSGIYRRIIVSRDIVESNLDKMLTNLD